jgi:alkyldihydroxyacetonephosphate synthase
MNEELERRLRGVVPDERLTTDLGSLQDYSHDWWPLAAKQRQLGVHEYTPDIAVVPASEDEVVAVLRLANELGVPVTPWGLGSSVTGAPLPTCAGIVLDLRALVNDPHIDRVNNTVSVAAGVRGDVLEAALNEAGYTLGHAPQSLARSSVGGWLATRATGQLSSRYGGIENLVVGYTVARADGRIVRLEAHPRAAMGPDLRQLFLGSEGTLGVITSVTLKLFPLPEQRIYDAFTLPTVAHGIEAMRGISQAGLRPSLVRFYDEAEARHATRHEVRLPVLFLGNEGIGNVARAEHDAAAAILAQHGAISIGAGPVEGWLSRRFDFSMVEGYLNAEGGYAETIEVASSWSSIGVLYAHLTAGLAPLADEVLGHFSHMYEQGTSLYVILLGKADSNEVAAERIREIWRTAMKVAADAGAELSHHHGVGLARKPYIAGVNPGVTELSRDIKAALDPKGILNPGKLFDR